MPLGLGRSNSTELSDPDWDIREGPQSSILNYFAVLSDPVTGRNGSAHGPCRVSTDSR
jgi:hypothetical protein